MNGLLIEFDLKTGRRAGGIDPRDHGLRCYGWQNLDEEDLLEKGYVFKSNLPPGNRALELRIIVDGRDPSIYEGIPGITVLRGNRAINEALDKYFDQYRYVLPSTPSGVQLLVEALKEKGLKLGDLDLSTPRNAHKTLKMLHEKHGIKLIRKVKKFEKLPV